MANGRIEKGQPVASAISAAAWNRAQDAADIVLGASPESSADAARYWQGASNIVLIRNDAGQDMKACGILGIQGLAIGPDGTAEMPSIVTRPVLIGNTPTETTYFNRFAITLEPIKTGRVGRAAVCGVVAFRLIDRDFSHQFATVKNGYLDRLQSAACGALQIIARDTSVRDGWKWAVGAM